MRVVDTFDNNADKANTTLLNKNIIDAMLIDELVRRYEVTDKQQIAFIKRIFPSYLKDTQTKGKKWDSKAQPPTWLRLWKLFIR